MIVDGSAMYRESIPSILSEDPSIVVTAVVPNAALALQTMQRQGYVVDVVLIDMANVTNGLDLVPQILALDKAIHILMMSKDAKDAHPKNSILASSAGAHDYSPKPDAQTRIDFIKKIKELWVLKRKILLPLRCLNGILEI
jgi:chemotaxis response regulator CheB